MEMRAQLNTDMERLESLISEEIGAKRFNVWFKNTTRFELLDGYLRISAPNNFILEYLERNFSQAIESAAKALTGSTPALSFVIDPKLGRSFAPRQQDEQFQLLRSAAERPPQAPQRHINSLDTVPLKGKLSEFVVGPSNRFAHAAAVSVVEAPGAVYNPLFIHGGCGVGKSHLLQGICNALRERHPHLRWRYVGGEDFTNSYIAAVKAREAETFNQAYRNLDVLVIDDVHFLANKRGTQEMFLHTLKSLEAAGKQIVLASDAPPKLIGHFSDSLVSRFLAGMVARVDSPDPEVRVNVLRKRAERLKVEIGDAVIRYIAENFRSNIRELEGALLKVVAQAQITGQAITINFAEKAIRDLIRHTAPVVFLSDIENVVCIYFGLTPADLHTSKKSRTIALVRGITMYLARRHTGMSFPEIGRFLGNKNHSTVILACRRISKLLQHNAAASWMTPMGLKEQNLAVIISEIEEQFAPCNAGTTQSPKPVMPAPRPAGIACPPPITARRAS